MPLPESFIQELKARSDITEVVSPYVSLRRRGRNMVGLCPFHGEKTPSFNIYTENGSFYCFGCGVGGDVISFVMKIENLDYIDAVKLLAQRAGMTMPEDSYDDSMSRLRKRIYEANREAARFYYQTLYQPIGKEGLDYLHGRVLSDRTIRHFGLGFADDDWSSLTKHLKEKGFSENELVAANLAVPRRSGNGVFDRFTNRVMFPIIDLRGNVIAFGGRIMTDQKPKYLNTSDTPVFKKSENLFSLNNAKNAGSRTLLLCEGYMDVIAVNQAGFQNAVATLGTALTKEQATLMKRYADEVIICYDADEAGQKATARAIPLLRGAGLLVRVISIPNGKDPDEFIKSKGADGPAAFQAVLERSGNDIDYRLQKLRAEYNTDTPDGRVGYLEAAAKVIAALHSPIEQDVYAGRLSKEFQIDKTAFMERVKKLSRQNNRAQTRKNEQKIRTDLSHRGDRLDPDRAKAPRSSSAEEAVVCYLVRNPDSAEQLQRDLPPEQFQNTLMKRFYSYFLARILDGKEPLNNLTADFPEDERNRIYQMLNKHAGVADTRRSLQQYITIIQEEGARLNRGDIGAMSGEQLNDYLKKKRETINRKGDQNGTAGKKDN